jgi:polar amino acid transport system substrate-binding protein
MPAGTPMAAIASHGVLTVGVLTDVPPFDYVDPSKGEFQGADIDIARQIAAAIFGPADVDAHLKFRALTNAERFEAFANSPDRPAAQSPVDLVIATTTVNCARRALVDFSVPYYDAAAALLVLTRSSYRSINDLGGRKVCATNGTTSLQHVQAAASHPILYPVTNVADCLVALQEGKVDAVLTDNTILDGMAQQDPNTTVVGQDSLHEDEPYGIEVPLGEPAMTSFVDGVLAQIEADGTWGSIMRTHLGTGVTIPPPPAARYVD